MSTAVISEDLLHRIQGEYTEMPGLRVTQAQAQRLWGLDDRTCHVALEALVSTRFLRRTESGQYVRLTDGMSSSWDPALAHDDWT